MVAFRYFFFWHFACNFFHFDRPGTLWSVVTQKEDPISKQKVHPSSKPFFVRHLLLVTLFYASFAFWWGFQLFVFTIGMVWSHGHFQLKITWQVLWALRQNGLQAPTGSESTTWKMYFSKDHTVFVQILKYFLSILQNILGTWVL